MVVVVVVVTHAQAEELGGVEHYVRPVSTIDYHRLVLISLHAVFPLIIILGPFIVPGSEACN